MIVVSSFTFARSIIRANVMGAFPVRNVEPRMATDVRGRVASRRGFSSLSPRADSRRPVV
jgi:hypothetical protein